MGRGIKCSWALVAFLGAACSGSEPSANELVVRDSAGVRLWEYPEFPPTTYAQWTTAPEPTLSIGAVSGEEPYLFAGIRGVVPLPNGGVAVGDGQSSEIRYFDAEGGHVLTAGGVGEGPGEFRRLRSLFPYRGDSVAGVNTMDRTISIFDAQGNWARNVQCAAGASGLAGGFVEGAMADGAFLIRAMEQFQTEAPPIGYQRAPVTYLICSPEGEEIGALTEVPGRELETRSEDDQRMSYFLEGGRQAASVLVGDDALVGATDRVELWRYGQDGTLKGVLRVGLQPAAVTEEVRDRWLADVLASVEDPEEARGIRQSYRERIWADSLPAFSGLRGDAQGNLWVRPFVPPYEADPGIWWVFGPDGELLAKATIPSDLAVGSIGPDFVLGVMRDEFDVEQVVSFRLQKG